MIPFKKGIKLWKWNNWFWTHYTQKSVS